MGRSHTLETHIKFGPNTLVEGPGARVSERELRIDTPGRYTFTGVFTGSVVVDAPGGQVTLVLDSATITNPIGPAVHVVDAAAVIVELAGGSMNTLTDGGESEYDAALYSNAPLTIAGTGTFKVEAVYEGISSTSHISIESGTIVVRAGEDGLNANDDGVSRISVSGGYLFIESETGDGIDSNGTLEITGGTVIALVAFGSGEGGLDADGGITITGGTVVATATRAPIPISTPGLQKALILDVLPIPRVGDLLVVTEAGGRVVTAVKAQQRYSRLVFSSPAIRAGVEYSVYMDGEVAGESRDGVFPVATVVGSPVANVRSGVISRIGTGHPGVLGR